MAVTQFCNFSWHSDTSLLSDPSKHSSQWSAFNGKTVLFVGERFVPFNPTGRRTYKGKDGQREASSYLPKIVLALGAKCVEAVSTEKYAKLQGNLYDLAVFPDEERPGKNIENNVKCINVHWLKEYLISRLSP